MKVIRAKTAGFCKGVELALHKLDEALNVSSKGRLIMLGPIVHNPQVLADYARRGVIRADAAEELHSGDTVVIRAHGIPRHEEFHLLRLGIQLVDATCPKVKQAQLAIAKATEGGIPLYLFGEADHPEVRGLLSYANGPCHIFGSLQELKKAFPCFDASAATVLAAQTTQERGEFEAIQEWLQAQGSVRVLSTICDATRKRQQEAKEIAAHVDAMFVVGGKESGNTRRLADIIRNSGISVWHVETPEETDFVKTLQNIAVVGITAGASTPKNLIEAVQEALESE